MALQSVTLTFTGAGNPNQAAVWPAMVGVYGVNWGASFSTVTTDGAGGTVPDFVGVPTTTGGTVRVADPNWAGTVTILLYDISP